MRVVMGDRMGVGTAVVGVGEAMPVRMGVIADQGIRNNYSTACQHYSQRQEIPGRQLFPEEQEGKQSSHKRTAA